MKGVGETFPIGISGTVGVDYAPLVPRVATSAGFAPGLVFSGANPSPGLRTGLSRGRLRFSR